ncbi:hypothetical protein [Desulfoluna spongiiphila]|uniref:hypothetical protein n=1 Tax=Desulfoluna spongiiphila TaxID=419481 RepID=UPI00111396D0|nr:hypothetical protein [Desulfoluna spongiiphila]
MEAWPFDQASNVTAITTRQVLEDGHPILRVTHYSDDHSWAFLCGTTDNTDDGRIVGMGTALQIDPSLRDIADLPVGWCALRKSVDSPWQRAKDPSA